MPTVYALSRSLFPRALWFEPFSDSAFAPTPVGYLYYVALDVGSTPRKTSPIQVRYRIGNRVFLAYPITCPRNPLICTFSGIHMYAYLDGSGRTLSSVVAPSMGFLCVHVHEKRSMASDGLGAGRLVPRIILSASVNMIWWCIGTARFGCCAK